ncbi:N-acetyltransferase 6 [Agrilus planipennis]|uniref:N-acetyltransferase 6 n=1 Tax=Agrilus planipennis TaxID=224129 RepID=A0A1W4WYH2_AGRPL|nr:N-acetyltransferase 6 [Agrilus planipennis]
MNIISVSVLYIKSFMKIFNMDLQLEESDLKVVPLHHFPEYTLQCCRLLNNEWKRSDAARLHSLKSSSDSLPTSLILLINKELIGHCKLSPIPSIKHACFIESVVIDRKLRGKGYGSFLMREAEKHCKNNLNLKTIYLSTTDRISFYFKLGYSQCEPVSIYGGPLNNKISNFNSNNSVLTNNSMIRKANNNSSQPTPPVPPPPPPLNYGNPLLKFQKKKIYMKRDV